MGGGGFTPTQHTNNTINTAVSSSEYSVLCGPKAGHGTDLGRSFYFKFFYLVFLVIYIFFLLTSWSVDDALDADDRVLAVRAGQRRWNRGGAQPRRRRRIRWQRTTSSPRQRRRRRHMVVGGDGSGTGNRNHHDSDGGGDDNGLTYSLIILIIIIMMTLSVCVGGQYQSCDKTHTHTQRPCPYMELCERWCPNWVLWHYRDLSTVSILPFCSGHIMEISLYAYRMLLVLLVFTRTVGNDSVKIQVKKTNQLLTE